MFTLQGLMTTNLVVLIHPACYSEGVLNEGFHYGDEKSAEPAPESVLRQQPPFLLHSGAQISRSTEEFSDTDRF